MARIEIFDTTLRDGEQSPGATMTPSEKLRLAQQLDALNVDIIEAGFPISSEDDFLAVSTIAREVRRPVIAGLARATTLDIDRAAAALQHADRPRLHTFLASSPIHLKHKLRIGEAECLDRVATAVAHARTLVEEVEFSPEDALRTSLPFLCRVVEVAIQAGARIINIPDTVGYAHPAQVREAIATLFRTVPGIDDVVVSVHCHNDLGLAVANSLAAIEAGARQVECTINGIGERAGNAALEEVVMALAVRHDAFQHHTGINTRELHRASQLLAYITGIQPQPNKAIVGRNAFAHEAGIHQDGVIKERSTYEIMTPELVGVPESQLVLGKHSGRNALGRRYRELGYELAEDALDRAYKLFKLLADQKKYVLDEDLISILHHGTMEDVPERFRLAALDVVCGKRQAEARTRLEDNGVPTELSVSFGDGPLAAAFAAVDALIPFQVELEDLKIQANPGGPDAVGEVNLRVKVQGKAFTGRGASPDVVVGAVRAYLHALNKAAHAQTLEAAAIEQDNYLWGV
ncbi:MAG: 2-isopropylmalate synthase [Gemmatimonadetes bacterium]|nr:2-isopropylmalate synthase [Gemmatimonadota bacterium]